jgi:hypothetical protein
MREQLATSNEIDDIQFGYHPKSNPEQQKEGDKPTKIVRLVRTPLDGVDRQIEEEREEAAVANNENGRNRFNALFSGQRTRTAKEDHSTRFLNLSLDRVVRDEED